MTDKYFDTKTEISNYGLNLWRLLQSKHITREELAEAIGLSDARMIYRYENGEVPSFKRAILIAKVLGVTIDSMLQ